ncbi:hypothetical protein AWZ03_012704 [Drosophila navojoa]|uniref:Uncharacterized protein n=1 Tax=Drosophila navojoa TaxID=7232 RepID=A0A484AY02_DRONA|nr:hypothetical protein AWZ03_012704 [Drosophila navojoa]
MQLFEARGNEVRAVGDRGPGAREQDSAEVWGVRPAQGQERRSCRSSCWSQSSAAAPQATQPPTCGKGEGGGRSGLVWPGLVWSGWSLRRSTAEVDDDDEDLDKDDADDDDDDDDDDDGASW